MVRIGSLGEVNMLKILISAVCIIVWITLAIVAANMAYNRGRSKGGFFALALFINPFLAIILLACLGDVKKNNKVQTIETKPLDTKPLLEVGYDDIRARCSSLTGLDSGLVAYLEQQVESGILNKEQAKELYESYAKDKNSNPFSVN